MKIVNRSHDPAWECSRISQRASSPPAFGIVLRQSQALQRFEHGLHLLGGFEFEAGGKGVGALRLESVWFVIGMASYWKSAYVAVNVDMALV